MAEDKKYEKKADYKKEEKKSEEKKEEPKSEEQQAPGPQMPSLAQMLSQILDKKDAQAIDIYVSAVVEKFGKYIKSMVIWGSKKTKVKTRKTSDIDIAIIVDDTDVRRMTRGELKEKLFQRLLEMGYPISKKIHPQPYLLTEFWQYIMEGNPVLYNVLRDGIIVFDTGFFMPVQMLMKMGNIKPSKECVDKHMYVAEELLKLSDNTMLTKMTYDLEQAVVSSAQAVLMELGYRPPAPNEVGAFVKEVLVDKEKLVDQRFADIATATVKNYKDIEHKEKKTFTGAEWDKFHKDVNEFVKKMKDILTKLRKQKGESFLFEAVEKKKDAKVTRPTDLDLDRNERPTEKSAELITKELGQR